MRMIRLTASFLLLVSALSAQPNQSSSATTVPRLVRINNTFHAADGQAPAPAESVTLSIYRDEQGGSPLWQETQNVSVDSEGRYNVLMGSTLNDGLPVELFSATEPRWLGVKFNRTGEVEQPRTRLASVPYALKASDAETLGGKPASAYLLAETPGGTSLSGATAGSAIAVPGAEATAKPKAISGNQGYVPYFIDASSDLGNSVMQQASGSIGVGTVPGAGALSTPSLDLRTFPFSQIGMGQTTDYLTFFASDTFGPAIYWDPTKDLRLGKGGTGLYNPFGFTEQMRIQSSTGNVGIGTQTPGAKLDVNGSINFSGSLLYQGSPVLQAQGLQDTAVGLGALTNTVSVVEIGGTAVGSFNTAIGTEALNANVSGSGNTAVGGVSLQFNKGNDNTAVGFLALQQNQSGNYNTAGGYAALANNATGSYNTGVGYQALQGGSVISGNTGSYNTAIGEAALQSNTTGSYNTATGYETLQANTTGIFNTAVGDASLLSNQTGNNNVGVGGALTFNQTGSNNIGIGQSALLQNTSGGGNVAVGFSALQSVTGDNNTAVGLAALQRLVSGAGNIAVGSSSGGNLVTGINDIDIGNLGSSGDNGTIRIGTAAMHTSFFVAGVNGVNLGSDPNAVGVLIDTMTGQLGVASSSLRYKEDVHDMGAASHDLMQLRPVTFRYKQPSADGSKPIQYGLIAEEVADVYPDLVAHSANGQIETVKYQVLDSMLLNEVQRQQAEIRRLEERLARLESILGSISEKAGVPAAH